MAGNKKKSSSSFSSMMLRLFRGRGRRSSSRGEGDYEYEYEKKRDDDKYVKAYRVYPSDEDRGRWVAEPRIDEKASAYISLTTHKWGNQLDSD